MHKTKAAGLSILTLSVSLALGVSLAGCDSFQSPESLVQDAAEYIEKGDEKAAVIQLKNALQKNGDLAEARFMLAQVYVRTGDGVSAEKEIRRAMQLGINNLEVKIILGKALLMQNHADKLITELAAPAKEHADLELLSMLGTAYLIQQNRGEAKRVFSEVLAAEPGHTKAIAGLANLALAEGHQKEAIQLADLAVQKNEIQPEAWLLKGEILRIAQQPESSMAAYDKVLSLDPQSATAYIAKAELEIGLKRFEAAKNSLNAAKKYGTHPLQVLYTQGYLDFTQANYTAAHDSLQEVLRAAPEHMPSLLLMGAVQLQLGASQQAEQHLKKYLENDPGNLYATKMLGAALSKNGQPERALNVIESALKTSPNDPELMGLAGEIHMKNKNYNAATEYFSRAAQAAPNAAPMRTALGLSHLALGDERRAIMELEKALAIDTSSSQAGITLMTAHMQMKNFDKALEVGHALEKEQPANPLIPNMMGAVYLEKKDRAAARTNFEKALVAQPTYLPAAQNLALLDLLEKKPESAKMRFERILEKDPKNAEAMYALADLAKAEGKKEEAIAWLERAVKDNPNQVQPTLRLAALLFEGGDSSKSLSLLRNLQVMHPSDERLLNQLGQYQLATGDPASALESYTKRSVLLPASGEPHLQRASILMGMGKEAEANEAIQRALALQPDYIEAQLAKAGLFIKNGKYDEAMLVAKQLQKQHPRSPVGLMLEGDIFSSQNQFLQAITPYEKGHAIAKDPTTFLKVYVALKRAKQNDQAQAKLNDWLQHHPKDIPVRMQVGTMYLADKQYRLADKFFEDTLKIDPRYVPALNNLAYSYQAQNNPLAKQYAQQAYELAPNNAAVLDTLGWILVENGEAGQGVSHLKKAAQLAPASMEIRFHLAQGLVRAGDKEQAKVELRHLINQGEKFKHLAAAQSLMDTLHPSPGIPKP